MKRTRLTQLILGLATSARLFVACSTTPPQAAAPTASIRSGIQQTLDLYARV